MKTHFLEQEEEEIDGLNCVFFFTFNTRFGQANSDLKDYLSRHHKRPRAVKSEQGENDEPLKD